MGDTGDGGDHSGREAAGDGAGVAVVDIGSGSVKLLITDRRRLDSSGPDLEKAGVKTKLMVGGDGRIADVALEATAEAFDEFALLMARHRPAAVAVVSTEVARTAVNVEELGALVEDKFAVSMEVLSGSREAELSLAGASAGRQAGQPLSVIDIGAGSTEFATSPVGGPVAAVSLPVGGRALTDHYLLSDPYRPEELSSALTVMELHLDDLKRELPGLADALDSGTIFGVGAVEQIAQVEYGSQEPDHSVDGYRLEKAAVEEVFRVLATESASERAFNPGLKAHHVDDIVGAMCVLVEFMRQFAVAEVLVSDRGLMHGLAADLLAKR